MFFYRYRAPLATIRKEWETLRDSVRNGRDPQDERKARQANAVARAQQASRHLDLMSIPNVKLQP